MAIRSAWPGISLVELEQWISWFWQIEAQQL
jgi:hypothetical protein